MPPLMNAAAATAGAKRTPLTTERPTVAFSGSATGTHTAWPIRIAATARRETSAIEQRHRLAPANAARAVFRPPAHFGGGDARSGRGRSSARRVRGHTTVSFLALGGDHCGECNPDT